MKRLNNGLHPVCIRNDNPNNREFNAAMMRVCAQIQTTKERRTYVQSLRTGNVASQEAATRHYKALATWDRAACRRKPAQWHEMAQFHAGVPRGEP